MVGASYLYSMAEGLNHTGYIYIDRVPATGHMTAMKSHDQRSLAGRAKRAGGEVARGGGTEGHRM